MKLTEEQFLQWWQTFTFHARRVHELKNLLLDLKTIGSRAELDNNDGQLSEIIREINYLYRQCMLPIVGEITGHVLAHKDVIEETLREENGESVLTALGDFLDGVQSQVFIARSPSAPRTQSELDRFMQDEEEEDAGGCEALFGRECVLI